MTEKIDELFAPWDKPDTPGCALAVVREGEIVYSRGYGLANLGYSVPITPATIFHVASVSKQFTAMAAVLLAQDGKLSLDDDIRKYLPEVPIFSSDYPHFEGSGDPVGHYANLLTELPDATRSSFFGDNLAACFARMGDPIAA